MLAEKKSFSPDKNIQSYSLKDLHGREYDADELNTVFEELVELKRDHGRYGGSRNNKRIPPSHRKKLQKRRRRKKSKSKKNSPVKLHKSKSGAGAPSAKRLRGVSKDISNLKPKKSKRRLPKRKKRRRKKKRKNRLKVQRSSSIDLESQ